MYSIKLFLLLVASVAIFSSCTQVAGTEGIPNIEQFVVSGFIHNGVAIDSILFTKTLPIQDVYDKKNAELTDVKATIENEGKIFNLVHSGDGYYKAVGLLPQVGKRYKLKAVWNGKEISAETFIPDSVVIINYSKKIDSVLRQFKDQDYYEVNDMFSFELKTPKGTFTSARIDDLYFRNVSYQAWDDTLANGNQFMKVFFSNTMIDTTQKIFPVRFTTYDVAYFSYLQSVRRDAGGSPFGTAPPPVRWNVKGDGIGLFIGGVSIKRELEFK